jgi:hypothetical protein
MRTKEVQRGLNQLGWDNITDDGSYGPMTRQAVRDFQWTYAWHALTVDGQAGPQTWSALTRALDLGGRTSPNFRFVEFRCKDRPGRYRNCQRIALLAETVRELEVYRAQIERGVRIVSGYRCWDHNKAIGGAVASQHPRGTAVDIEPIVHWTRVANMHLFPGIGKNGSTGLVRHVDNRAGSPARPTVWTY